MHIPLISLGPLNDTIIDLNKPKIIINSGELTYLDYLPTKQKVRNISRTQTHEPLVFGGPLNDTKIHFKRALNYGEWWKTPVLSIPPLILVRICRIWLESRNSGGMDRIPDGFLSIPCTCKRKTTLHKTDQSYTKEITIKGISSYVQNYHIRKNSTKMKLMTTNKAHMQCLEVAYIHI